MMNEKASSAENGSNVLHARKVQAHITRYALGAQHRELIEQREAGIPVNSELLDQSRRAVWHAENEALQLDPTEVWRSPGPQ
jgi:hypothetical protein